MADGWNPISMLPRDGRVVFMTRSVNIAGNVVDLSGPAEGEPVYKGSIGPGDVLELGDLVSGEAPPEDAGWAPTHWMYDPEDMPPGATAPVNPVTGEHADDIMTQDGTAVVGAHVPGQENDGNLNPSKETPTPSSGPSAQTMQASTPSNQQVNPNKDPDPATASTVAGAGATPAP